MKRSAKYSQDRSDPNKPCGMSVLIALAAKKVKAKKKKSSVKISALDLKRLEILTIYVEDSGPNYVQSRAYTIQNFIRGKFAVRVSNYIIDRKLFTKYIHKINPESKSVIQIADRLSNQAGKLFS